MHPTDDPLETSLAASTVNAGAAAVAVAERRIPALTLIAHPDLERIGERASLPALVSGQEIEISRLAPAFAAPGGAGPSRALSDPRVSRRPLRLGLAPGEIWLRRGDHPGEIAVDGVPLGAEHRVCLDELARGVVIELAGQVALLLHAVRPATAPPGHDLGLAGASDAIAGLRQEILRVAGLEVSVLLRGESGSGKELVARALHDVGPRRGGPFVALNMAALPSSLAAAELFGAERGAFTGADRRRLGAFRRADGGTLFLDEIGAAATEVQDLLLRALETREIQPVGSDAVHRVDVRLVAATDADLDVAITGGAFRLPLLHRLSGWGIRLPALRDRRDDVARLLVHFLREELTVLGAAGRLHDSGPHGSPWLPAPLVARLTRGDWPGNVRQLRNVARQLAVGGHDRDQASLAPHLEQEIGFAPTGPVAPPAPSADIAPTAAITNVTDIAPTPAARSERRAYRPPTDVGDAELVAALRAHRWRLKPAAAALGLSRASLYARIDRCPLVRRASDLGREELEAALLASGHDVPTAAEQLEVSLHGLLLRLRELGIDGPERG
jgi:two-component system nitrogen regulation response regulator GlnG